MWIEEKMRKCVGLIGFDQFIILTRAKKKYIYIYFITINLPLYWGHNFWYHRIFKKMKLLYYVTAHSTI